MLKLNKDSIVDILFCLFLTLAGLGNYYNELFQIGGVVVPADIGMALFVCVWVFFRRGFRIERRHMYLIVCFVMMLIVGMLGNHSFGDILRDVKVFLYFFVAYLYLCERKDNYQFISRVSKTIVIMLLFTIVTCAIDFFQYGLSELDSNQILRTFGLGLSQTGLAAAFIIFWAGRDLIKKRTGKFLYYFILISCIVLTVVSYTRSNWILLAVSVLGYFVIDSIRYSQKQKIDINSLLRVVLYIVIACLVLFLIYRFVEANYPAILQMLVSRVNSIAYFGTGESYDGNVDTFSYRINEVLTYSDKYFNLLIIVGWGFGDRLAGADSTIAENSFLYYTWKYGFIWCAILAYKLYDKFRTILSRNNKINNAVFVSLISYFILGGLSGHLNKYYMLPYIAILLLVDFDRFLRADSEEEYYGEMTVGSTDTETGDQTSGEEIQS